MAEFVLVSTHPLKGETIRYAFDGVDPNAVVAAVGTYFARRGYVLEAGTPVNGTYGKGSAVGRALVGGFAPRFKFKIAVHAGEGAVVLDFSKAMSGVWGGVRGLSKLTEEFAAIHEELTRL